MSPSFPHPRQGTPEYHSICPKTRCPNPNHHLTHRLNIYNVVFLSGVTLVVTTISRPTLRRQNPVLSPPTKRGNFNFDQSTSKVREDNAYHLNFKKTYQVHHIVIKLMQLRSFIERKAVAQMTARKIQEVRKGPSSVDKIHLSFDKSNSAEVAAANESKSASSSANSTGSPKTTKHLDITSSSLLLTRLSPVLPRSNAVWKSFIIGPSHPVWQCANQARTIILLIL